MPETDPPNRLKRLATRGFMAMNLLLVGAILWRLPAVLEGWAEGDDGAGTTQDTGEANSQRRSRNPSTHLPLKGMTAFQGDDKDACLRMEGFLLDMDYQLAKMDLNSRVPIQGAMTAIKTGQCAIDTPAIASAIAALNAARLAVGLPRVPPADG